MKVRTEHWQAWLDEEMGALPEYWLTNVWGHSFYRNFITYTKPTSRQIRRFKKEAKRYV